MSVDINEQLRVLGEHLERDSPRVDLDEVLSRIRSTGNAVEPSDTMIDPVTVNASPGPSRRSALVVAAAVIIAVGLLGVVAANRPTSDIPDASSATPDVVPGGSELVGPAVFPVVGDQAAPRDFGSFSLIGRENPERISALVARRTGDSLSDSLWVTATLTAPVDEAPADTNPAEAVGEQIFDVHGRAAEVWTEPFEVPVQHVRFEGEPTLEVTGFGALAFMQAAGPDVLRVTATTDAANPLTLEIGNLPDGYEVIVEPFREPLGTITASIGVGNTETTEGSYVGVELSNPLPSRAAYTTTLTTVDINGHTGWIGSGAGNYVTWEPIPGTFATVGGTESADESIALARSICFVDRATWQAFYNVGDPVF